MNAARIGLFGGSFDPVHQAHVALARLALDELHLTELRWIPTGQPWHKTRHVTPAAHREAMVRIAMGDEPRGIKESAVAADGNDQVRLVGDFLFGNAHDQVRRHVKWVARRQ